MFRLMKYCLAFALVLTQSAYAVIDLQLTQGVQGAIPVAVLPFAGQSSDASAPDKIAGVIHNDLQNSGRFRVSGEGASNVPDSAANTDFAYWAQQNVNDMVVGSVKPAGGGRYQIQFQLLNPYANTQSKKTSGPAWQNAVLLSRNFTVDANQLRAVAHHISDLVYENLTGDKGVFSTRIAYVVAQQSAQNSRYTLEVADMDGYNPKPLLTSGQPIMSPAWSPDGQKIAYVSFEQGRTTIYVQDVATGQRQLVSNFPGLNSAPAWSPDSRKLAVVLTRTGAPKIFVMNVGSQQVTQVTQGDSIDTEPVWSADGRSIYFTSSRGGQPQIYRSTISGGNTQRVTFSGSYNASASLSPDGKVLAVLNGNNNQFNIAVQDLSSGTYTLLTQSGDAQSPSIAPNGKMVIYATQAGGRGVLGMTSTDGRVKIVLPGRDGEVREPAWGPLTN
ncbi:MAG: Tol-Pal system beta propeller repeat protein TolB [Gammaproteobacteria bacterium]